MEAKFYINTGKESQDISITHLDEDLETYPTIFRFKDGIEERAIIMDNDLAIQVANAFIVIKQMIEDKRVFDEKLIKAKLR